MFKVSDDITVEISSDLFCYSWIWRLCRFDDIQLFSFFLTAASKLCNDILHVLDFALYLEQLLLWNILVDGNVALWQVTRFKNIVHFINILRTIEQPNFLLNGFSMLLYFWQSFGQRGKNICRCEQKSVFTTSQKFTSLII